MLAQLRLADVVDLVPGAQRADLCHRRLILKWVSDFKWVSDVPSNLDGSLSYKQLLTEGRGSMWRGRSLVTLESAQPAHLQARFRS